MTEWQRRMFAAGARTAAWLAGLQAEWEWRRRMNAAPAVRAARKRALRAARERERWQRPPVDWHSAIDAALVGAAWGVVAGATALLASLAVLRWEP